jgi:hypothetical protein
VGYVIAGILVVLIVGGFVAFLVMNARGRDSSADSGEGGPPGIGRDKTPLGDMAEHAGEQTAEGETVGGQDAERSGGSGRAVGSGYAGTGEIGDPERDRRER